jgi:hypothetical protein
VAQQALGGHHHQRPAQILQQRGLAAQQVEVLGGGRAVADPHVALGRQLEEALQPGRGVFRPLPLVAVRQQQDETGFLLPLGAGGDDELVDQHLCAVGEVAELRLPQHQRARGVDGVAVLEADRRRLRQRAVVDRERSPGLRQVLQGQPPLAALRVVQHQVAL